MLKKIFALLVISGFAVNVSAGVIQETIEAAAKLSGKVLTRGAKKAACKTLSIAVQKHGDDVLKAVRHGGFEALKQGAKYGDDFWRLAKHASPKAARSLALHADELMPVAKRLGTSFVKLEGKVPGLASKAVAEFGDDAARHLAAKASPNDISKLIGYASKADSPATKKLLMDHYKKGGSVFLKKLDSKVILASGLSAAMVISAYKISDGFEEGIEHVAKEKPETFQKVIENMVFPFKWLFAAAAVAFILPVLLKWIKLFNTKKSESNNKKTVEATEAKCSEANRA